MVDYTCYQGADGSSQDQLAVLNRSNTGDTSFIHACAVHGNASVVHGTCMWCTWYMHVFYMVYTCVVHGTCMCCTWYVHVVYMVHACVVHCNACVVHGTCMWCTWYMHVLYMVCACGIHGTCMCCTW